MTTTHVLGGYTAFRKMEEKEEKVLWEKTESLDGISLTPLCVATQVVGGGAVNYRFLCEATAVTPDAKPYNVVVGISSGETKIDIKEISIG